MQLKKENMGFKYLSVKLPEYPVRKPGDRIFLENFLSRASLHLQM